MIESAVYTLITSDTAIQAIIGTKCYPGKAPETATAPYIIYQRVSGQHLYSMTGLSGIAKPRFQFDCWGSTLAELHTLWQATKKKLAGYSGTVGSEVFQSILVTGEHDILADPQSGQELPIYGRSMDAMIAYTETTSN